jgi:LytS/YehU family sensor histidine kinase
MHRDTDAAEEMLARLSDLLRLTFEHMGTQTVALTDELEFLHKYLDIERVRFGDRLDLHVEVAPDTLDASVPYLLLQPLVENALRHGIAPKVGGGRVEVTVKREGDTLQVVVQDNGVGLSDEKLAALQAGVGIGNTRSRLERLYGNRHRFELYRPAGGGLGVAISIPFLEADAERTATAMESVA